MSDMYAFFYNSSTQRPDRNPKKPLAHTNIQFESTAQPVKPVFKRSATVAVPAAASTNATDAQTQSSSSSSRGSRRSYSSSSNHIISTTTSTETPTDRMTDATVTPLIPQKRSTKISGNPASDGTSLSKTHSGSSGHNNSSQQTRKNALLNVKDGLSRIESNNWNGQRTGSIMSSTSNTGTSTAASGESTVNSEQMLKNPYTRRYGRRYLKDASLVYPLPCDLSEYHRQTLRTMLLVQSFGSPVCSPSFQTQPPQRVLEVGCGTGYWSSLCHQHFMRKGHSVSFTGLDIVNIAPDLNKSEGMKWTFVQHDLRKAVLPFENEEFDLVMAKDLSWVVPETDMRTFLIDEYIRVLKPGGSIEVWENDHLFRTLCAHTPKTSDLDDSESEDEEVERANMTGTYIINSHTPFAPAQNPFIIDYNTWATKSLQERRLTIMPCAHVQSVLMQEPELTGVESRRLAIPFGDVRWEREGVGVAKFNSSSGSPGKSPSSDATRKVLSTAQASLRRTALLTVVQKIDALEPIMREANGKGQDEWDRWVGNMMSDLLSGNGTSGGECLEIGAWWAKKKEAKGLKARKGILAGHSSTTLADRSLTPISGAGGPPSTAGSQGSRGPPGSPAWDMKNLASFSM